MSHDHKFNMRTFASLDTWLAEMWTRSRSRPTRWPTPTQSTGFRLESQHQKYSDPFGFRLGAASPSRLQCRHVDAAAARTPDGGLGCYDLGVDVRVATSCLVTV